MINNNQQQSFLPIEVLPSQPVANVLIYASGGGTLFPDLQPDQITPALWYHGGYTAIDNEVKTKDCNVQTTVQEVEVVSPSYISGIIDIQSPNTFWDEVYTTPLGLYQHTTGIVDRFLFKFTNIYEFTINVSDVNIIPNTGDYIVIQKFNETQFLLPNPVTGNTSPSQLYTDGISNLPVYPTETWIVQIQSVASGSSATEWDITIDKSFVPITDGYYTMVLLNRKNTLNNVELFLKTWQLIEVHKQQLLGDQYNYLGFLRPKGKTNFLNYTGSEYLGLANQLGLSNSFIILDFENNIQDHLYYADNSVKISLPCVLFQGQPAEVLEITNTGKTPSVVGDTGDLVLYGNTVGKIYYDLRIMVLTDMELITVLSYNSNRNFTLPAPVLDVSNTNKTTTIENGISVVQPYTHFVTYYIQTKHYNTAPYSITTGFNWNTNDQVQIQIPELTHLVDDNILTGFEGVEYQVIIGKNIIDSSNLINPVITGTEQVVLMPSTGVFGENTLLISGGIQNSHQITFSKTQYDNQVATNAWYDLTTMYGANTPENLLTGNNCWLLGQVEYRTYVKQYQLKIDYKILAENWNGTTNPTFDNSDDFQDDKLITEVAIVSKTESQPAIYAKISPPIPVNNLNDLLISLSVDF